MHELAIFDQGPEKGDLNVALLKAEAALRKARKLFGGAGAAGGSGKGGSETMSGGSSSGTLWWFERELAEKKEKYGPKK